MKKEYNIAFSEGEQGSPFPFLMATRKWNPVRIDAVPMKISEHEYKRNVDEMGEILYRYMESQVQRSSKNVPSSATESNGSKDPREDEVP